MLEKEISLNKKFIIILLFLTVITLGMYSSYAYYEVSVIKNSVIVLKTATIDIVTDVVDKDNNTFTISKGSSITLTVNLTTELTNQIGYKMYYEVISGISTFDVTSTTTFPNDIVEGDMTLSKSFSFTFTNTGQNDITIKLGTQGGLTGYPIPLEQGIELKLNETLGVPVKDAIKTAITNNTTSSCKNLTVEEDEITYLSGTSTCINFNYVWYSGKLWRITAINLDGTMKMITDDPITTILYNLNSDVNFYDVSKKDDTSYTGSYIYQWLNEDFLDTLYNHENIIVEDSTWNITNSNASSTSAISTKLPETTLINNSTIGKNTSVGLLNSYEYYLSYKNTSNDRSGYLNIGYYWWLLNPYSSSYVWYVNYNGIAISYTPSITNGVNPSINLKSNIQLSGGSGTKDDPYTISGDKEQPTINTTLLNTRTVGEYVVFDEDGSTSTKEIYRIVGFEDGKTKLNKNDYIKSGTTTLRKKFSTNTTYGNDTSDEYWDYYLNNTWYNSLASKNMLDKGTYYLKQVSSGTSYKNSLCNIDNTTETTKDCIKTTNIWNSGYVGLPRYGEMFASQQGGFNSRSNICLITPLNSSYVWHVNYYGNCNDPISTYAARPSIFLKSNVVITGGSGTQSDPFTIALK